MARSLFKIIIAARLKIFIIYARAKVHFFARLKAHFFSTTLKDTFTRFKMTLFCEI